jgi:HK97 family phage prohead protease
MNKEIRTFPFEMEIRKNKDDEQCRMVGHAAIFNSPIDLGWGIREQIAPGAFTDSIGRDDVRALFNHDPNFVLGRNRAGTLSLKEDDRGLAVIIDPPDTQFARDLIISMERGDITQMSFAFITEKESWTYGKDDEEDLRTIEKVQLWDVSPVTYPAYADTDIAIKSRDLWKAQNEASKPPQVCEDLTIKRLKIDLHLKEGNSL